VGAAGVGGAEEEGEEEEGGYDDAEEEARAKLRDPDAVSDDEESEADDIEWNIGFVEPCPSDELQRQFFPCKVGDRPAWLDPVDVPTVGASGYHISSPHHTPRCGPSSVHDEQTLRFEPTMERVATPGRREEVAASVWGYTGTL
jgi:hypothetical protein